MLKDNYSKFHYNPQSLSGYRRLNLNPRPVCHLCNWTHPIIKSGRIECEACGFHDTTHRQTDLEPQPDPLALIQLARRKRHLTYCLEILESFGITGDWALLQLSLLNPGGVE